MSWFDEQLSYRKAVDDENFADAFEELAGAVMGRQLAAHLSGSESAQSAIEEILRFFRFKPTSDELPPQIKTLDDQLDYILRPFGIMRRTVTLSKGWYKDASGPMLGFLRKDGRAVALIPAKLHGYTFFDVSTGKRIRLGRKTEILLEEEAFCFYKPLPQKKLTVADLLLFIRDQLSMSDIIMYVGMIALTSAVGLLSPMFTKWLLGGVLQSGSTSVLISLAAFMMSYTLGRLCISLFRSLVNARVGIKQNIAVQAAVMNRIMSLPPPFFKKYASGELTQRAVYVEALCSMLMNTICSTGLTSLFSLIYIGQIFAYAPSLVVPSVIITLLTIAVSLGTTFFQMHITKQKMLSSAQTSGMTYSMIRGIQKIKQSGAEKRMFSRWAKKYAVAVSLEYDPPLFLKLSETISLALTLAGTIVLYASAIRNNVSVADYYAFNAAYGMVSSAFTAFAGIAVTIAGIRPTLDMARPILETEPEMADNKEIITRLSGNIELSNVSFRYDEDMPFVIDNLSLKIKAGEYVAIVGTTGCGKSTLMRLLLGFEKPQKGSVYYDRKNISRVDLRSLRRKIGVVMQEGKLFLGDIYSNIVISAPHLTLDDAWEAAETASIADDIRRMPMGMNTLVCDGQGGFSGGQRQRLMIARAIAPKPKILMFDEATSALDNVTQKKISQAVDSLKCTRIIIAHRLSTIRRCDRIIVLDKGNVAEEGTYEELIGRNGLFAELVKRQRLDIDEEETA